MNLGLIFIVINYRIFAVNIFSENFEELTVDYICNSGTFYTSWFSSFLYFYSNVFMLNDVFICYSIIFLKSPQDVIQGISKLDYLLKVSVFQIYKDPNLRLTQFQISRMQSKLRESNLYENHEADSAELN